MVCIPLTSKHHVALRIEIGCNVLGMMCNLSMSLDSVWSVTSNVFWYGGKMIFERTLKFVVERSQYMLDSIGGNQHSWKCMPAYYSDWQFDGTKVSDMELICSCIKILLSSYCDLVHSEKSEFYEITQHPNLTSNSSRKFPSQIIDTFDTHAKYLLTNKFSSIYEKIVDFYKQFLSMQDLLDLPPEHYFIMVNVLSIPWILEEENFHDLWDEFLPVHAIKDLDITINRAVKVQCLESLVLLPQSFSHNWKSHIFTRCLSHDDNLALVAIRMLPFFLYSSLSPLKSLFELKPCLLKCKNLDIVKELSKLFKIITCICSGACSLYRHCKSDGCVEMLPQVKCSSCEKCMFDKIESSSKLLK
ncbi:hypothetical protein TNCV_2230211 [Trichonephila clavipes]|uniref:Uncharacterized protein n=1 Tax=Trichonephila clavipes TaxID=2585209 RepID=A0A8X6WE13_TRICX|nr:hypothetical protein TNCV_2230211 [Trichonephila clavipes]